MIDVVQVVTTTGDKEGAEKIARALLERRLAACVRIEGPVESHYRWKGEIESANEWVCTIKTLRAVYQQVEAAIRELHPYDEPEILAFETAAGSRGYLQWVADMIDPPRS